MDIRFDEINDLGGNKNYFDVNSYNNNIISPAAGIGNTNNYWDLPKEDNQQKKVTYDDILSSLNLVISPNGVLQYMTVKPRSGSQPMSQPKTQTQYQSQPMTQYQSQPMTQYQSQQQYNQSSTKTIQHQTKNSEPLDPQVKNSFIFNKYFKDYKDPNIKLEEPKNKPQTVEEYNKALLEDRIRIIKERNRIAQIKSTKILFENKPTINVTKNNLRRMPFN
jgi:hypothetical protein